MKRFLILFAFITLTVFNASAQTNPPANVNVGFNFLGQNTPAIAATEAQYEQMWAQDVAAMVGYHEASAAVPSSFSTISSPITLTVDYSDSQSSLTFTSGSIPAGDAGYELTVDLKSSIPNLQFDEPEPIADFDLENDVTLLYSDGINTTVDPGTIDSYDVSVAPEPSTWALFLCGVSALSFCGYRRNRLRRT